MNTCILFHYEIITHLHAISVFCNDVWATGLEIKRNKHSNPGKHNNFSKDTALKKKNQNSFFSKDCNRFVLGTHTKWPVLIRIIMMC